MILIDTHAHLYLPLFAGDIEQVIQNAIDSHVVKILLPNIDNGSIGPMLGLCEQFPHHCHPMIGLHPTSVKEDYSEKLSEMESLFGSTEFIAIGETGMDAYWDTKFMREQEYSFIKHIEWAKRLDLPVVIHSRKSMDDLISVLKPHSGNGLRGVFHAFSGTPKQAEQITEMGFKLGLGGVITYKNSGLAPVIEAIDLENLLLETDSPYLSPVPLRGKRNESANILLIAKKIAGLKGISVEEVARKTTENAAALFNLDIRH